jgi:hypothetical protein
VGKGAIWKMGDENIQKGKRVVLLDFHSKLDVGVTVVKMVKERHKRGQMTKVSSTNRNQHLGLR